MNARRNGLLGWLVKLLVLAGFLSSAAAAFAAEPKDLPPRRISLEAEYPGIVVPQGEDVNIDLVVTNGGRSDEVVRLKLLSIPPGWKARIKTYSFGITGIFVKSDSSKNLTLRLEQDKSVGPGNYAFEVEGKTDDGQLTSVAHLLVTVEGKKEEKKAEGVSLQTSYPVLQGPTDGKFEFSLEVQNKLDKDTIFNLTNQAPENWVVNFKPAYEDKFISSLRLKAGQSQSVAVEVKPFGEATPGEYPITVTVNSPEAQAESKLTVILSGTYKMELATSNDLLSLSTVRGQAANISFYVRNSGSAPIENIKFLSFKPENWKIEFKPEQIDLLPAGELKQVEMTITPSSEALVGDYSVGLNADAGRISKNLELRVTVKASTAWGWIGIGLIILVMAALVLLFVRLGRR